MGRVAPPLHARLTPGWWPAFAVQDSHLLGPLRKVLVMATSPVLLPQAWPGAMHIVQFSLKHRLLRPKPPHQPAATPPAPSGEARWAAWRASAPPSRDTLASAPQIRSHRARPRTGASAAARPCSACSDRDGTRACAPKPWPAASGLAAGVATRPSCFRTGARGATRLRRDPPSSSHPMQPRSIGDPSSSAEGCRRDRSGQQRAP